MRKMTKFFITCGAVCVLGIILTAAGFAAGGVENMEKVEQSHSWFHYGSGNEESDLLPTDAYDSIKAEGNMDIAIVGPGFAEEMDADFAEDWIADAYENEFAGNVMVNYREGTEMPEVKVEKGVLIIKSSAVSPEMEVNLSTEDSSPNVVVFCDKKKLDSIEISTGYGDIAAGGIECDNLNITNDSGDIEVDSVTGGKLAFKTDAGDIAIENCTGDITAEVNSGDIEFDSALSMDQFGGSLHAGSGDVQVNDSDKEVKDYSLTGGPNKLTLQTKAGDIEATFFESEPSQQ